MKKLLCAFLVLVAMIGLGATVMADGNLPEGYSMVFRLYNPKTGEHLYTGDTHEYEVLSNSGQWNGEGGVFLSHADPATETPVFRLQNPNGREHLYTTDSNEITILVRDFGWIEDNHGDPIFWSSQPTGEIEWMTDGNYVYRLVNQKTGLHLLTNDQNEVDTLTQGDWKTTKKYNNLEKSR